jgi:hypothetical protein
MSICIKKPRKYNIQIQWQAIALKLYCPHLINMQQLEKLKLEYRLTNIKTNIKRSKTNPKVLCLSNKIKKSSVFLCLYLLTKKSIKTPYHYPPNSSNLMYHKFGYATVI